MKSIMHDKRDGTCYLCMAAGDFSRQMCLEEHHCIHGTANRQLSERWGLKVYLCPAHHRRLHNNEDGRKDDIYVMLAAQAAFKSRYPDKDFKSIFGRNIIDTLPSGSEKEVGAAINAAGTGDNEAKETAGFIPVDNQMEDIPF